MSLNASVSRQVIAEVLSVFERLSARFARERLYARVRLHVMAVTTEVLQRTTAHFACVLLAGLRMALQCELGYAPELTFWTGDSNARMFVHVSKEFTLPGEVLVAVQA